MKINYVRPLNNISSQKTLTFLILWKLYWLFSNTVYNLVTSDDMLQMDLGVQKSIGYTKLSPDLYFIMSYSARKIQYIILCGHQTNNSWK